jgi:LPXTG-site transpeptidase (sortase) family protein
MGNIIGEGFHQVAGFIASVRVFLTSPGKTLHRRTKALWNLLAQPVLIPRREKPPRKRSRLSLFVLDVLRFGSTFACLFLALFLSLNYQSFWEITRSYVNPLERTGAETALTREIDTALKEKLLRNPALPTAGEERGELLSYLPAVGPPENRIIIPKLALNIPLVTPSYQALLTEDWSKLEEDIQDALQYGVVHYPGTARPGQAGNFFVTGHSSYYPWSTSRYKTVFARLHQLEAGDEYWVYYGGDKHRYVVREKYEVSPNDVTVLDQPLDHRIATLMTCTPVGTTLRRLIVKSEEVDPQTGIVMEVGEQPERELPAVRPEQLPI